MFDDPCSKVELPDSLHPETPWKMIMFAQHTGVNGRGPAGPGLAVQHLSTPKIPIQRPLWSLAEASIPPGAV